MAELLTARVRGARPKYSEGIDNVPGMTTGAEALVVNGLPLKSEYVRLGQSWSMMIPTGSAFTNVATMPTTLAELILRNGEPGNGRSYLIDQIGFLSLTSVTAAAGVTIIYQVNASAVTDETAVLINSPIGAVYGGKAERDLALTTFTANKWTPLASVGAGAAASIGLGVVAEVAGGIILRPGFTLGVNAVVGTATGTSLMSISWVEVDLL
jgi:hypothetical protein